MRWWSADPQKSSSDSSNPTSDREPACSEPPANPRERGDKSTKITSRDETVEQALSQYLPVFAEPQTASEGTPESASGIQQNKEEGYRQSAFGAPFPETMSCRDAFDTAMHCRGPGGQFVNLYRYGEFRQCSEQWSQFWFCMRTRTKPAAVKRELIRDWYRQKEEAKYGDKPSSEDIWEQRKQRLERAFNEDLSQADAIPLEDTRHRRRQLEKAPDIGAVVEVGVSDSVRS